MQTVFITKLIKIGTSKGIVIPKSILDAYHWERGDPIIFGFHGGEQLFIKRVSDIELDKLKPVEFINI